ncbi:prephenate dehydrogenase [Ramlibacter sp. MAHUQ-53]|uniref:prephenate dehydrogenase n=1 Tax=unclassified Ramlibacter TaxID=2617605 RepID=UPI0036321D9D
MFQQLGLIGCGLMGGSFALALRQAGLVHRIVGYSKSAQSTARARELGVIDEAAASAADAAAGSDLVLVAVPVAATEATLAAIRESLEAGALVMDVGSTKQDVVEAAQRALGDRLGAFVPCHPITGKESAGVDHADAGLYQGRLVVLTPTADTPPAQAARAQQVWEAVGGRVRQLEPLAHDTTFAAVSHLPHLLAFAFINGMSGQPDGPDMLAMGGPGFRDFTRIAAGDPQVWRDILLANRAQVLAQARLFEQGLAALEKTIEAGDAAGLQALIQQASDTRSRWRMGQD